MIIGNHDLLLEIIDIIHQPFHTTFLQTIQFLQSILHRCVHDRRQINHQMFFGVSVQTVVGEGRLEFTLLTGKLIYLIFQHLLFHIHFFEGIDHHIFFPGMCMSAFGTFQLIRVDPGLYFLVHGNISSFHIFCLPPAPPTQLSVL